LGGEESAWHGVAFVVAILRVYGIDLGIKDIEK